jgi:hypothetical protein
MAAIRYTATHGRGSVWALIVRACQRDGRRVCRRQGLGVKQAKLLVGLAEMASASV